MRYSILLSKTAVSQLNKLEEEIKERIKASLQNLAEDPFQRRSGADIKRLVTIEEPPYQQF